MTETAQPLAAEPDAVEQAASAFKVALGQAEPDRPRNEKGQFASAQEPEPDPETTEDELDDDANLAAEAEEDAEALEVEDEAEEDAQPEAVEMPRSWPKEDEEAWNELPATAKAKVAEREAQRDRAVNQKFEEAAQVRKASMAQAEAAQGSRLEYLAAINQLSELITPQEPPLSMIQPGSPDYNPDSYHYLKAQAEQVRNALAVLGDQRQQTLAQARQHDEQMQAERFQVYNTPEAQQALINDVPDIVDPAKQGELIRGLMEWATNTMGVPADTFASPTSVIEWHMIWKAREFDRLQAAKAKVGQTPPPEPRKASPAIKPGVTTPRSTVKAKQRQRDFDRLRKTGSIEDGAAVFKHFLT